MSTETRSFNPAWGQGQTATAGAASARFTMGEKLNTLCLTNFGTDVVYIRSGLSAVAATTADYPLLGGSQVTISKFQDDTHVAYIAPAGSPSIHIIPGQGL